MAKTCDLLFANAERLMRGDPLLNAVDPTLGYEKFPACYSAENSAIP